MTQQEFMEAVPRRAVRGHNNEPVECWMNDGWTVIDIGQIKGSFVCTLAERINIRDWKYHSARTFPTFHECVEHIKSLLPA